MHEHNITAAVASAALSLHLFDILPRPCIPRGISNIPYRAMMAAIIEYFGSESEIVIPSSLGGRTVTELRGRIFRSRSAGHKIDFAGYFDGDR